MKSSRLLFLQLAIAGILLIIFCLGATAQETTIPPRVTEAVDVNKLVILRGNTHPLARPEFDRGAAPDSQPMRRMLLVLKRGPEQEAELRHLLDEQQTKSSPNFHRWLAPEEFGKRFGLADEDIQAVTDWLAWQGFEVSRVAAGRTVIEFSGTAGEVRQAFHTEIHKYAVNGEEHAEAWANSSDPQIPAALAPVVTGFASLNSFPRKPLSHILGTFSRSKATGEVRPLFTFSPVPNGYFFAVGPTDFATIYNVLPLWNAATDGTGQTIAIVGETNINIQDVRDFRTMFGLPAEDPNIILDGPDPGIIGDEPEADLDVEWTGAVAKGATIDLVVSESTEASPGVDLSALYIVDNNLAPVMSISYGPCEAELGTSGNLFHSLLWEQAAAQGITVLIAAGDSGSDTCDYGVSPVAVTGFSVNGLASTPFNVAVGGTDFDDASNPLTYWDLSNNSAQASALSYIPESTWNDTCASSGVLTACANAPSDSGFQYGIDLIGGGGGPSNCINSTGSYPNITCSGGYAKPSWQTGLGVPSDGARDVPDLSLFAGNGRSYSFYVFCEMDANSYSGGSPSSCDLNAPYLDFQGAGGTSISVQAFAGIMALVNQAHGRQGNANYVLYSLAAHNPSSCDSFTTATTNSSCTFYDITVGNNSVACAGGTPNCSNTSTAANQYGILVEPGSPTKAAWPTTTGYDLATGLGSVNAANLVNKWASVTFTPSTTTLSLSTTPATSPITLVHGQAVNVSIQVSPKSGTGTPAGDVSLIAQVSNSGGKSPTTGVGEFTLSGGTVSGTTNLLPAGTYNVVAHYAGDGTFGASDSSPVSVTVTPESSVTKVGLMTFSIGTGAVTSSNATTVPYGSIYLLRVDVTNSSGNGCAASSNGLIVYACPTGQVTVTDNGAPLDAGTYPLNSQGYAEDQALLANPLAIGTHNVAATYAGDVSYAGSKSPTDTITITRAVTTTTITNFPSSMLAGRYLSFDITVQTQSAGVAPNCNNVQILNGGTVIPWNGDCTPINGSFSSPASLVVTPALFMTGPGSLTLTAQYIGDSNYAPSTSAPVTINVTDFSISANPTSFSVTQGQSGTTTLTLTPLSGFTGSIALSCNNPPPGATCTFSPASPSVTGSSAVTATLTLTTSAQVLPVTPQRKTPSSFRVNFRLPLFLAGLLALAMLMSLSAARRRPAWLVWAAGLLVVGVWAACGGGGGGGGGGGPAPAPVASFSATSLTFGNQNLGTISAVQTVTLSNTGNALLSVSSIVFAGANTGDFGQSDNCGGGVAAGANCTINVTFTPAASGTRTASLAVTDNATGSPQTISLTGSAVGPAGSFSPTSLTFAGQDLTLTSPAQTVTLSNAGNAVLSLFGITIYGTDSSDFAQTNTCGSTVAAGANCAISLTFTPTASGTRTAWLATNNYMPGSPQAVSLTGTGVPYTPKGSYTFTVMASAAAASTSYPLAHSVQIAVTVQ